MSNQKSITQFFKRKSTESPLTSAKTPDSKKARKDEASSEEDMSGVGRLAAGVVLPEAAALRKELNSLCESLPVLHRSIGISWYRALKSEFEKPYFKQLSDFVCAERKAHTVYPPAGHVFSWTHHDAANVRVVILGQDPYHGPGQAHGLCFSVQPGVAVPPSLRNMYKELESDVEGFRAPDHGFLLGWARQGVLLLNACLTVRSGQPNSHANKGWERLTDAVIQYISGSRENAVFLLWGAFAQKKAALVDQKRHHILKSTHPSPLSAHRGFLGCKHFSQCNQILKQHGLDPIDWTQLATQ